MPYATYEEVQAVLARSASRQDGTAASITEEQIKVEIEAAASEIDAKLAALYTVPFEPVPTLINHLTVDIAAYRCDLIMRQVKDYNTDLNPVYLRYQNAQALLTQLQSGQATIPPDGDTPGPGTGSGTAVVSTISRPPLFSVREFDIDPFDWWQPPYDTPEGWAIH